ncbi:MAG TPA: MBL fold metallo-hydrolase [Micromonosporaceae bacterium]
MTGSTSAATPLAEVPAWVSLVRAPNPGPMTLDGTNTWVLRVPGGDETVVIDPGPLDEGHLVAVANRAEAGTVVVVATHGHDDHVAGLDRFLALCQPARVWSPDERELSLASGLRLTALSTPGHTADSISVLVGVDAAPAGSAQALFTGDTILGRGTTVVAHPDGDLGDYLDSLHLIQQVGPVPVLPGHGPALADAGAAARFYLDHRLSRLDQVRAARAAGAGTPREVVEIVYAEIDRSLWPAAEWSVRAQLAYLDRESQPGSVRLDRP